MMHFSAKRGYGTGTTDGLDLVYLLRAVCGIARSPCDSRAFLYNHCIAYYIISQLDQLKLGVA